MRPHLRPEEPTVFVQRQHVPEPCPVCHREEVYSYPVLTEGGWWYVTKCLNCLHSIRRERWNLLGPFSLLSENL